MSEQTNIAWTDSTVNFWSGCTKVSPGCANCYAETRDKRHMIEPVSHWGPRVNRLKHKGAVKDALALNRKPWICPICSHAMTEDESKGYRGCPVEVLESDGSSHKPKKFHTEMHLAQHHRRRIFSLSLGDWLDDEVPIEWLAEMLETLRVCQDVTWILCTKRPENWREQLRAARNVLGMKREFRHWLDDWYSGNPPANIILLTSVENQKAADERIPELLQIPAACHGLSMEPLLGPVSLRWLPAFNGMGLKPRSATETTSTNDLDGLRELDWLIIGGESGAGARPCNVDWIRSLVAQGKAASVATFVKQLGANPFDNDRRENLLPHINYLRDKKGGDISEWPEGLRVQEWPTGF